MTTSSISGKQPSGLIMYQTDTPSENYLQLSHFFGYTMVNGGSSTPTPVSPRPTGLPKILSMKELYGYESDTTIEKFIYAGKINFKFVVPAANLTGTMYKGKIRVSQMQGTYPAASTSAYQNGIRMSELITIADKVEAAKP